MITRRMVLAGLAAGAGGGQALRHLFAAGPDVRIPPGLHTLDLASPDDCLVPRPGAKIIFEPGAVIRFRNVGPRYVPAIAVCQTPGVSIHGARFEWAGELQLGPDFPVADPSWVPPVSRLATANPYPAYFYASAISVLESPRFTLRGFTGRSLAGDGSSVIHSWISASRADDIDLAGVRGDDCCLLVVTQGGDRGAFRRIRGGRLCQDIGIPGHVLYTWQRNCVIEDITDDGIETGRVRRISHSVSAANGPVNVRRIRSRRASGPLNIKNASAGGVVDGVDWSCFGMAPRDDGGRADKLYLVAGTGNAGLSLRNVTLRTDLDDAWLVGGEASRTQMAAMTLERHDRGEAKYGFIRLRGDRIRISGAVSEAGSGSAALFAPTKGPLGSDGALSATVDLRLTRGVDSAPKGSKVQRVIDRT